MTPAPVCRRRPRTTWTSCTCPSCVDRTRRLETLRRLGRIHRRSAEAWAEVDRLLAAGWTDTAIATAAGLPVRTISGGLRQRTQGIPHAWSRLVAEAILTHTPTPPSGMVSALGARRRLQALAVAGWSLPDLSPHIGLHWQTLTQIRAGNTTRITPRVASLITATYAALEMAQGPSPKTRANARRYGWAPALAWDDESIDDPDAQPSGIRQAATTPAPTRRSA